MCSQVVLCSAFKLFRRWEDWNVSGEKSSVSATGCGGALRAKSEGTSALQCIVKLLLTSDPQILRSDDTADLPPDPGREEHFQSFTSSSQRGEVVCQVRAWRRGHDSREEGGFENLWTIGDSPCMPSRGHFQPCSGQLNKLLCLLTFTTRMFKPRNYFLKFWQTL